MTDQEINVAIAEACGWTHIENRNSMAMGGHWFGYPPANAIIGKKAPIPDFASDLNAMHEAVNSLTISDRLEWLGRMEDLTVDPDDKKDQSWFPLRLLKATPRIWAEAFLRTIEKWSE